MVLRTGRGGSSASATSFLPVWFTVGVKLRDMWLAPCVGDISREGSPSRVCYALHTIGGSPLLTVKEYLRITASAGAGETHMAYFCVNVNRYRHQIQRTKKLT